MTLRSKWPYQQYPRHRILHPVEHSVKMRAGDRKVSGALLNLPARFDLILQRSTLIQTGPTGYAAAL